VRMKPARDVLIGAGEGVEEKIHHKGRVKYFRYGAGQVLRLALFMLFLRKIP
jgi:hypothetical protein